MHSLANPAIFNVFLMVLESQGNARRKEYRAVNGNNDNQLSFSFLHYYVSGNIHKQLRNSKVFNRSCSDLSGTEVRVLNALFSPPYTYPPLPLTLISDFCPLLYTVDPDSDVDVKSPSFVVPVSQEALLCGSCFT